MTQYSFNWRPTLSCHSYRRVKGWHTDFRGGNVTPVPPSGPAPGPAYPLFLCHLFSLPVSLFSLSSVFDPPPYSKHLLICSPLCLSAPDSLNLSLSRTLFIPSFTWFLGASYPSLIISPLSFFILCLYSCPPSLCCTSPCSSFASALLICVYQSVHTPTQIWSSLTTYDTLTRCRMTTRLENTQRQSDSVRLSQAHSHAGFVSAPLRVSDMK